MDKELEVIINVGVPASGKSTWAKAYIKKNPNYVRVSRDDFRYMLKDCGFCEPKIEKMITDLVNNAILTALSNKLNVIVDNTNLKAKVINEIIDLVSEYANVTYRVFEASKETLYERDAAREHSVGRDVIDMMWNNWMILKDSFIFQDVKKARYKKVILPNFESDKQDAVTIDLDGTLCYANTNRNNERGYFDWDKVYKDDINKLVAEQIEFHKSKGRKILILTGRDASCRKMTEDWLSMHGVKYDELYMRPENNYEKDSVIKRRIIENDINPNYNILCAYDDRKQVTDMLYSLGIYCFNCNQGAKNF